MLDRALRHMHRVHRNDVCHARLAARELAPASSRYANLLRERPVEFIVRNNAQFTEILAQNAHVIDFDLSLGEHGDLLVEPELLLLLLIEALVY